MTKFFRWCRSMECCKGKGRSPVVMTKYREHAQMLYARLEGVADHVFLLQGGGSMKSRTAIRQQMLAVNKDETMIIVAIGQYIGEGFNYPRLDTMLLAMPISFEGNVEHTTSRIVVSSPSLSARKVLRFISLLQDKGISAVVFTREPEAYPEDGREHQRELICRLLNAGIRVIPQNCCYERYAVIDDAVVWYGSMNLLSNAKVDDNVMRLVSPSVAAELMEVSAHFDSKYK